MKLEPKSLSKKPTNPEKLKIDSKQESTLHVPEQNGLCKGYQCVICKEIFQSAENLTNHIINFHPV